MLKLGRRLIYELSSVVVGPIKRLLSSKKKEDPTPESRVLSTPIIMIDYLDRLYFPLYYGISFVTASSFYYSSYKMFGPVLNQSALACLKMAASHPYSIGLSVLLLSDLPIILISKGIILVLTKVGRWTLRRIGVQS